MYTTAVVPMVLVSHAKAKAFFDQVYEDGAMQLPDVSLAHRPSASYIFLKDDGGSIVGGSFIQFTFDIAAIDVLWVKSPFRGRGAGSSIFREIERLATEKGMKRVIANTFEFQGAIPFWNKMGLTVFARLDDYPVGSRLCYLHKILSPTSTR